MTLDDWKTVLAADDRRILDLALVMAANAGGTHDDPRFDRREAGALMRACDQRATHRACARAQEQRESEPTAP